MKTEASVAIDKFRRGLETRFASFKSKAQALIDDIKPYSTELNTYCEGLRTVAQQVLEDEFEFKRTVSGYDLEKDSITISHIFECKDRLHDIVVKFTRNGMIYRQNSYDYINQSILFERIGADVLEFYSAF